MKAIAALRNQFGGHAVLPEDAAAAGDEPVRPPAGSGAATAGTHREEAG
jgi:hypothetical protein